MGVSINEDMQILEEFKGVNNGMMNGYLVQMPPERRLMFTASHFSHFDAAAIDLPLPWQIYYIELPKMGEGGAFVKSLLGRPEAIDTDQDQLYVLPLPNITGRWSMLGHCSSYPRINRDSSVDEQVGWVLAHCWETAWRYVSSPEVYTKDIPEEQIGPRMGQYHWLGFTDNELRNHTGNLTKNYAKWEALSVEEILTFPFGRARAGTFSEFIQSIKKS